MVGWTKLLDNTDDKAVIAYSLERDRSCDGILVKDKKADMIHIEKLSSSATQAATARFACLVDYWLEHRYYKDGINCLQS